MLIIFCFIVEDVEDASNDVHWSGSVIYSQGHKYVEIDIVIAICLLQYTEVESK